MSLHPCPRCSDLYDSDQHTEPLCKTCMGKVETFRFRTPVERPWTANFSDWHADAVGKGRTEDEAILNLARAI